MSYAPETRFCSLPPSAEGGACCSDAHVHADRAGIPSVTREGFAPSPADCEGTCLATTGCSAFSHSAVRQQCVFCSGCDGAPRSMLKKKTSGHFTNWLRQRPGAAFVQLAAEAELGGQRYWPTANASGSPSSRTSCVSPRPCARGALTVALVLRGELYRWGCDALGVSKQRQVARAYDAMLATPLEQAGHCVHVVLALDRGCGPAHDAELVAMYGDRVALARRIDTNRQPANARAALDLVTGGAGGAGGTRGVGGVSGMSGGAGAGAGAGAAAAVSLSVSLRDRYDFVVFARHDVQLLSPLRRWACNLARAAPRRDVLSVGSQCDRRAWRGFNCSSDLMCVVTRRNSRPAPHAALPSGQGRPSRAGRPLSCCHRAAPAVGGAASTHGLTRASCAACSHDTVAPCLAGTSCRVRCSRRSRRRSAG